MKSIERDVALAQLSTMGVGGSAQFFCKAERESDLRRALDWAGSRGHDVFILGGGSNVVFADDGFSGLAVQLCLREVEFEEADDHVIVTAGAGVDWDTLVAQCVERDLGGLECLSGIPGSVGATPVQNVGAYGAEVSDTIAKVRVLDRSQKRGAELYPDHCRFAYRDSLFKSHEPGRYVVLSVSYKLPKNGSPDVKHPELQKRLEEAGIEKPTLAQVREIVLAARAEKSMVIREGDENARSCGSFFVNPIVSRETADSIRASWTGEGSMPCYEQPDGRQKLAAGWLIEQSDMPRGTRAGNVGLSSKHALSSVCHNGATSAEIIELARRVRAAVDARFGLELEPEPQFVGFADRWPLDGDDDDD